MRALDLPAHVGPCELSELGRLIAVRCPVELAHILRRAGAVWEPGSRRWLVQRPRSRVDSQSRLSATPMEKLLTEAAQAIWRGIEVLEGMDRRALPSAPAPCGGGAGATGGEGDAP